MLLVTAAEKDGVTIKSSDCLSLPPPNTPPIGQDPLTHSHVAAEVSRHPVREREKRTQGRALRFCILVASQVPPTNVQGASNISPQSLREPALFCAARSQRWDQPHVSTLPGIPIHLSFLL